MRTLNLSCRNTTEEEPRCLVPPQSKWYRKGLGFTCRQIMFPLFTVAAFLFAMVISQVIQIIRSNSGDFMEISHAVILSLMLALVIRAILFVRASLLNPLTEVRSWVSRLRDGDTSARIPPLSVGEFNDLANDINTLSQLIQTLHGDLQSEVQVQTEKLAQKTQALELLYEVVTSVNQTYEVNDLLSHFMHRLGAVYDAESGVIRVLQDTGLTLIDSYGHNEDNSFLNNSVPVRSVIKKNRFGRAVVDIRSETINERLAARGSEKNVRGIRQMISIPLQYRDSVLGSFQICIDSDQEIGEETIELLSSIGQHLGVAIEQSRLDEDAGKLVMVEERAKLANELHDSLAQTLASLRFQVRVLDETLHQDDEQVTWEELEKLEKQVEEANHELRSLIGRFRAPLQSQGVVISVEKLIRKFRQDTGVAVFFQNEWDDDGLSPEMRNQVIRIVQESLTNVKKHAEAKTVRVLLRHRDGLYRVMVEDDGIGFDESRLTRGEPGEHIGRQIMMERADSLGSVLRIDSEVGEGSSVNLEFDYKGEGQSERSLSAIG